MPPSDLTPGFLERAGARLFGIFEKRGWHAALLSSMAGGVAGIALVSAILALTLRHAFHDTIHDARFQKDWFYPLTLSLNNVAKYWLMNHLN